MNWRAHWVWFCLLLGLVSAADYAEHILRPGSEFADRPLDWLAFTATSVVTLCGFAISVSFVLKKALISPLVAETGGVALAVAFHLIVSGPFWAAVTWNGESQLHFDSVLEPVATAIAIYLAFRGLLWVSIAALSRFEKRGET